ncbi:MAG: hypothetical protein BIFFINMI_01637 [Phycisphaerae bacterium]|nr:hypothetical protein [Phycisphaerae bacterium]
MFRLLLLAIVLVMGVTLTARAAGPVVEIYVAPGGDDAGAGTKDKPLATPAAARDAVRKARGGDTSRAATVRLAAGVYGLAAPLVLGPQDSNVAWIGEEGAVLSGGQPITGFKAGDDGLWRATIPAAAAGKWDFNELFVSGRRATRARFPNEGFLHVDKAGPDNRTSFTWSDQDLDALGDLAEAELVFLHDWSISRIRIASTDRATKRMRLADPIGGQAAFFAISGFGPNPRYFVEDSLRFLDAPGEWFLDRSAGVLTYKPLEGETIDQCEFVAPVLTQLIWIVGDAAAQGGVIENVRIEGLTLRHCAFLRPAHGYAGGQACFHDARDGRTNAVMRDRVPAAVDFVMARGCTMVGCRVEQVGGSGIRLGRGCERNVVSRCTVADCGGNGVMIGEGGEPCPGNRLSDSRISRCGQIYFGAVGVWVAMTDGTVIEHNEVCDLPYTGISVGWSWNTNVTPAANNLVMNNHIHHVMRTLSDGGGIYTLGRQPGTRLEGNLIHDIPPNAGRAESNGMFLDEGSSLFTVTGNAIYRVARSPIRMHKAEKLTLIDNVLVSPPGVPTFRYNSCSADTMTIRGNRELTPAAVPALAEGRVGSGLACDGATVHVEVPPAAELEPADLTVECWVKVDAWSDGADTRRWLVNKNANEWAQGHYGLIVQGSQVGAYLNIGGGRDNCHGVISQPGTLKLSRWHHVAMTYDGKVLRVCRDGEQVASGAINKPRQPGNGPLCIGARVDGFVHFAGTIDEARIWRRALSADELAACFQQPGKVEKDDSLVRYWGFDQKSDTPDWIRTAREHAGPRAANQ